LDGGVGNDTLAGGAGNDTFVFHAGFGQDVITDFTIGSDVIELDDGMFADFAAVQAAATGSGNNTIIALDASNTITLQNVALANLHQNDFLVPLSRACRTLVPAALFCIRRMFRSKASKSINSAGVSTSDTCEPTAAGAGTILHL